MLTDREIRSAKPKDKRYKLYDSQGLFVLVRESGTKTFIVRYTYNGKRREVSIGKYPQTTLKAARLRASEYQNKIALGENPQPAPHDQNKNKTFSTMVSDWLDKTKRDVTDDHRAIIKRRIDNHVAHYIGGINVADLRTFDIKNIIDNLIACGKYETAQRCLGYMSEVLRYSVICGVCEFDVTTPLTGYIKKPAVNHRASLTDISEIGKLLRSMWIYNGTVRVKYGLRLSAYSLLRPQEVRKAEWSEIDLINKIWLIPASKMKMRKTHLVPLTSQMIEIFETMKCFTGNRQYVFSLPQLHENKPMSENAINDALKRMGYKGRQCAHGFRAMASTILHEQEYNTLHIEMQLAHTEKQQVKAAYNHAQYLAQRITMMQEYSDYLDSLRLKNPRLK